MCFETERGLNDSNLGENKSIFLQMKENGGKAHGSPEMEKKEEMVFVSLYDSHLVFRCVRQCES